MKRFLSLLLNSFLLSLWVTILVLYIFPVRLHKYEAKVVESGSYRGDAVIRFDDLDMDGISEKRLICHNTLGTTGLTLSSPDGFLKQWTFKGRYDFIFRQGNVILAEQLEFIKFIICID